MMKTLSTIVLGVALLGGGCSKKGDDKEAPAAAAKPAEPTKPEAAKPAKADPDKDKELVRRATGKDSLDFTSPTGDKVTVKTVARVDGDHFVIDVVVADKVVETIATGAEKPGPDGFHHYEAQGSVTAIPEGVLVVAGTIKVTGKPDNTYDARVLAWNATSKQLEVARKIQFEDAYDPATDGR